LLKLYDSLTREKREFVPVTKGEIKMYVCGVTVYNKMHIGNARTYVSYDIMREYFINFKNYKVLYIQNITDVGAVVGDADRGEDKIEKQARLAGLHPMEVVDMYIKLMWDGLDALRNRRPNISPRATGHIVEIIEAVQAMIASGSAYVAGGDVYIDVSKIKNYGCLSGNTLEALSAGYRIEAESKKRSPHDFSVWKSAGPKSDLKWNSPWGMGYPGWHIECSVMSQKYLGNTFDIHGGGADIKFPHHENEIAQSYALHGCQPVNYWVHTGMLNVDGAKMAKSAGNFITADDAITKFGARELRWFFVNCHYGSPTNISAESIAATEAGYERLATYFYNLKQNAGNAKNAELDKLLKDLANKFEASMDDDINTPNAVAAIYEFIKLTNPIIVSKQYNLGNISAITEFFSKVNQVFKVFDFLTETGGKPDDREAKVKQLIEERNNFRAAKNFAEADRVKQEILALNVELYDNKDGTTYRLK